MQVSTAAQTFELCYFIHTYFSSKESPIRAFYWAPEFSPLLSILTAAIIKCAQHKSISRVADQNAISQECLIVEIHHSGPEPLISAPPN